MGDKVAFKKLLYFDCDEETLANRVKGRAAEEGRKDDNAETLLKRFQTFNTSTKKIIEYFTNLNQVIHIAAKNTVDEVF
jgi:adenylate kinase family enzyme